MKRIFQCFWILLFIFSSHFLLGQDSISVKKEKKYAKYIDVRFENGAMLGTSKEIGQQLVDASYYNGFDIRLGFRKTDPYDVYGNVYRRPYLGVGYYQSTFHNEAVGYPTAMYFFLTMPFTFEENKKFNLAYTGAFGLSYNFNPYDSIGNPTNIFIGSVRNCYVHLGIEAKYKFNEKWALKGTFGFKHFSNGSFKQPNLGINLFPLTIAGSYKFGKTEIDHYKKPIPKYIKHNLYNITFSAGSKNYEHGEPNHLKTALGFNYLRQINYKYRLGIGTDIFYSADAEERNTSDASNFSKSFSFGIVGSWEWVVSPRVYVPLGVGVYLHRNEENNEKDPVYLRAGIRTRITEHFNAGVTIKAHKGVADFFEWTLAYTIHQDPNKY